jgi:hypothetical protein
VRWQRWVGQGKRYEFLDVHVAASSALNPGLEESDSNPLETAWQGMALTGEPSGSP